MKLTQPPQLERRDASISRAITLVDHSSVINSARSVFGSFLQGTALNNNLMIGMDACCSRKELGKDISILLRTSCVVCNNCVEKVAACIDRIIRAVQPHFLERSIAKGFVQFATFSGQCAGSLDTRAKVDIFTIFR